MLRTEGMAGTKLCSLAHKLYSQSLHRFIVKLIRNDAEANDVLQETYVRLLSHETSMPPHPAAYIFRVARSVCSDHRRNSVRQVVSSELVRILEDERIDLLRDATTDAIMSKQLLRSFLDQLPLEQQIAVLRFHRDDWSYVDIAHELRCTERAVERYLLKARERLRKMIEHEHGLSQGGNRDK